MNILTHTHESFKPYIDCILAKDLRNNIPDLSSGHRECLVRAILKGTNKQAMNLLNSVKPFPFLPGTFFIPSVEVISIFGVTDETFRATTIKHGIVKTKLPNDVRSSSLHNLHKIEGWCGTTPQYRGEYSIVPSVDGSLPVLVPSRYAFTVYSAKALLALSLYMDDSCEAANIDIAHQIQIAVKKSAYRYAALQMVKGAKRPPAQKPSCDPVESAESQLPPPMLMITPEILRLLLRAAVKELTPSTGN